MNMNDKLSRLLNVSRVQPDENFMPAERSVILIALAAAMALWFSGMVGTKDADVKKIVSLGIQGKRQLNVGEKTVLRGGR